MPQDAGSQTREADADRDDEDPDTRRLNVIYQEQRSDDQQSDFLRLENSGRADA
ncbi:MAG: hypothetical protein ABWY04_15060 [Arthrobacter sp.]